MILESDASLPAVPRHPAPWDLEGDAYAIALKLPADAPALRSHLPGSLADRSVRGLSFLMLVDYRRSDCGPYQEILFIPGSVKFGDRRCATIGSIYVSTFDSVVNGRRNWGIPKDRADFEVERDVEGTRDELVRVRFGGARIAELRLRASRFGVPMTSKLVPAAQRTIAQHWDGRTFFTTPTVSGRFSPARVVDLRFDGELFPDVSHARVLGAVKLTGFRMGFPVASVAHGLL